MLLSLVRVVFFIAFIVAATVACSYLIEAGGEIKLSFNGEEHRFAPIVTDDKELDRSWLSLCLGLSLNVTLVAYKAIVKRHRGYAAAFAMLGC